MKKLIVVLAGLTVTLWLNGCVPVTYTKTVVVHKDATGKVTEIEEIESITEPHSETKRIEAKPAPMTFEYLK